MGSLSVIAQYEYVVGYYMYGVYDMLHTDMDDRNVYQ